MNEIGRVDLVVIGAGVVGLAIARELARSGLAVTVIESESTIGTGVSSRNSEVIHAGLYYPPGSFKSLLCIEGRKSLYRFCAERGVDHRRIGKLVVATENAQVEKLEAIAANAIACGVDDVRLLSANEARALEPELSCVAALHSPSTGIVDSHGLMMALEGEAQARDVTFAFNTTVEGGRLEKDGVSLVLKDRLGGERCVLMADALVNAAGLNACSVASSIEGFPEERTPKAFFARGCYFGLQGKSPFSRLIYPVPVAGGLGVHLTLDLVGRARFGPDVEWIDSVGYDVDPRRGDAFYSEIRRYWPKISPRSLSPDYAGVRPKISGPGDPAADFRIDGPAEHGVPALVNLFGIESPGLTACLAIGELVRKKLGDAPASKAR